MISTKTATPVSPTHGVERSASFDPRHGDEETAEGRGRRWGSATAEVQAAATMMAADALHRNTAIYYQEDGEYYSVWSTTVTGTR